MPGRKTILRAIWERPGGPFTFLSTNAGGKWNDTAWSPEKGPQAALSQPRGDFYFTPLRYSGMRRLSELVENPAILWVDNDNAANLMSRATEGYNGAPPCSYIWETSPGHWQAVWLLAHALSPSLHRELNRSLAFHYSGDTGAWDLARVLRVPGSFNYKRDQDGYIFDHEGGIVQPADFDIPIRAPSDMQPEGVDHPATPDFGQAVDITRELWDDINPAAKAILSLTVGDIKVQNVDRSVRLYELVNELKTDGISQLDAWLLIWHAPVNKFKQRPHQLWKDIRKVYDR